MVFIFLLLLFYFFVDLSDFIIIKKLQKLLWTLKLDPICDSGF